MAHTVQSMRSRDFLGAGQSTSSAEVPTKSYGANPF